MAQWRARSDAAKLLRRKKILGTTDQLLRVEGFDAFTMNKLAAEVGLAKGTLYLYFSTREELVLALYSDLSDKWLERFLSSNLIVAEPDFADVCIRFYQSFAEDGLLVDLAARASFGLEPHVSTDAWVAAKRSYARLAKRLGGFFCRIFGADPVLGQRLAWAFLAALSGAQQRAFRPSHSAKIPADLKKLSQIMSCPDVFLNMVLPLAPDKIKKN